MATIESQGAPVEVIGVLIKRSDLEKDLGLAVNKELVDVAGGFTANKIRNADEKKKCAELIMRISKRLKELPAIKKRATEKLNAALAEVEAPIKHAITQLTEIKGKLNQIYTEYDDLEKAREAERIRKELQDEADRKAAEAAAKAETEAEEAEADLMAEEAPKDSKPAAPPSPAPIVPPVNIKTGPQRVQGVGTLTVIETTKVRVVDPSAVPEAYKVPSDRLLLEAYDAGITSIPGVEFYKEKSTRSLGAR